MSTQLHREKAFTLFVAVITAILIFFLAPAPSHGANVLVSVNARRAYIGLPALTFDPRLQSSADQDATNQANRGRMGHTIRAGAGGSRACGVGYTSRRDFFGRYFQTCYASTRSYRYAGAAAVVRGNRTYYSLFLR